MLNNNCINSYIKKANRYQLWFGSSWKTLPASDRSFDCFSFWRRNFMFLVNSSTTQNTNKSPNILSVIDFYSETPVRET